MPQPRAFKKLTKAQRREIAEQQVEELERQMFGHQLNKARAAAIGATQEEAAADAAIAKCVTALDTTEAEAAKLMNGGGA